MSKEKKIVNSKFGKNPVIWNYVNIYDSKFGDNVKIGSFVEIGGSKIGNNCMFEAFSFIPPGITIEDNVFVGPGVVFTNDKYPPSSNWSKTIIKKGAVIGARVVILPGVTIGEKAVVGAGAVVTKNIPAGETWIGSPAYSINLISKFPKFKFTKKVNVNFANFIVGFISGEGYFSESKNGKYKCFSFGIEVNYRDKRTIEKIKEFFEVGNTYERKRRTLINKLDAHTIIYQVRDKEELLNIIIPFFDNFSPQGNKKIQYLRWREKYLSYVNRINKYKRIK